MKVIKCPKCGDTMGNHDDIREEEICYNCEEMFVIEELLPLT